MITNNDRQNSQNAEPESAPGIPPTLMPHRLLIKPMGRKMAVIIDNRYMRLFI